MKKRIVGLDLGTNSIGWSSVLNEQLEEKKSVMTAIEMAGSRIIPMDASVIGDFAKGNTVSQTSERTSYRGVRRLRERCLLRRERLNRVLDIMGFLPEHYSQALTRYGKFKDDVVPKLAWKEVDGSQRVFIFQNSFEEMLSEFKSVHPQLCENGKKIPYDWTLYYLRKKALREAISKQELAWILFNFNQKRGYYQLRGEEEDLSEKDKLVEYCALKVTDVVDTGEKKGKDIWYHVMLENGMVYPCPASIKPDWVGKVIELIVTTHLEKDGTFKKDKEGNIKRSFRKPKENDWALLKTRTEKNIDDSQKTVGTYIYDALLANPEQKIKGKLVRTVERKYYKQELIKIIETQKRFIPELQDRELYASCIQSLYESNEAYRKSIAKHDFCYLFVDDIIFYQRSLKSKKSLIDGCPYEEHSYVDQETGEIRTAPVKCIAKSNPLYQEFRLWQFVQNLKIYERSKYVNGSLKTDVNVTGELLPTEDERAKLFDFLNDRKGIKQDVLFGKYFKVKKTATKELPYRWNYVEDKEYPCNETRALMLSNLEKAGVDSDFLTFEKEQELWHVLYSVEDKQEIKKAMETYAEKHGLRNTSFVQVFSALPAFEKAYGAYSEKAIKKLLPLMRMGKYWSEDKVDGLVRNERIEKIINGELDEKIKERMKLSMLSLTDVSTFRALPLWLACYVVYGRHSEAKDIAKWESPRDIDVYLNNFRQHSLRNPIVEQVVLETLRVVRDIWIQYGKIDEIHIEMGRDLKNPADKRKRLTQNTIDNENTNLRVKALLTEFCNPEFEIDNVRPYSVSQQDVLRIYEDGVMESVGADVPDDITEIVNKFKQTDVKKRPSHSEVLKYKMWLDQKYVSPYTGRAIPLSRLFTSDYEIEHIIPQSRYFDDSFSNKVICEAEVNKLKDRMLGYEFIKAHHGEKVQLSMSEQVEILSVEEYELLVQKNYKGNSSKMRKLLMGDIPDNFIERQLNDSRYISKLVKSLLSNVVREEGEVEAISKNVITCNGTITDRLKREWGVNDVWNRIILPRFKRLNELTGTNKFTTFSRNGHEITDMPLELQKGFNKKRIDHRHHAMDAIVIACTTRSHVNLLNNEAALSKNNANRHQLSRKLRRYEKVEVIRNGERQTIDVAREFLMPWSTFPADVELTLRNIVVSFKKNLRVINKAKKNKYQKFNDEGKKILAEQKKGDSWAIRKPMHKETVFGEVNLRVIKEVSLSEAVKTPKSIVDRELKNKVKAMLELGYDVKQMKKYFEDNKDTWRDVNVKKIRVYYFTKDTKERFFATRKALTPDTDINKITDSGIRKILLSHLEENGNDKNLAFSPEGIDALNRNIVRLNNGVPHKPILKVRVFEKADKYAVGQKGNKASKFVEAEKGTNLFFAVYETESLNKSTGVMEKSRSYASIPLNVVIERQKQGLSSAPENVDGIKPAFVLSPNDLVYLPTKEEVESGVVKLPVDRTRVYKMVSCTGNQCFFISYNIATVIYDKMEFGSQNKMERAVTNEMVKETCLPLKVDRLGNIIELNGKKL